MSAITWRYVTPTGNQGEKAQATVWKYEDDHINGL